MLAERNRISLSQWRVLPICVLIICLAAFYGNYTYATAPNVPEAAPAAAAAQKSAPGQTAKATDKLSSTPSIWPAKGAVTSGFGWRISPFGDGDELHAGIDIALDMGMPVVATGDGKVVQSGWYGDYGNMVQIDHGNGLATIYGHNSQLAVSVGQSVHKGQVISYAGSTGKSTGPHLHYEVRKNDATIDPWKYLVSY